MKILFATDGSDQALRACQRLLGLIGDHQIEARVLTVLSYDMYPYALVAGEHMANEAEMEEAVRAKVGETTRDSAAMLERAGYAVSIGHRFGNAGDEILGEIADWQPDLVVLGKRGLRGAQRWIGSVSERVIHRANVPLLVVP